MIHKVKHKYTPRMIVPVAAVDNNIDFLYKRDNDTQLMCSDDKVCTIKKITTINALSPEFDALLQDVYGTKRRQDLLPFLQRWYKVLDNNFSSIELLYIETNEPKTESVSE